MKLAVMQVLERLEHRPVVAKHQPARDMDAVVGVDPDRMRVEGSVMYLGQRNAGGHHRLYQHLISVRHDVGRIEKHRLG